MSSSPDPTPNREWLPKSRVRVAGICSVLTSKGGPVSGIWEPQSFQLLMRTPHDLVVMRPPSWWTYQHLFLALAVIVAACLGAVAMVMWMSHARLREQESRRARAEAEFAAILSERNRMAREIHDTLAQGLVATSVQLRLAKKKISEGPQRLAPHLNAAQQFVLDSLAEARNSIWNMRSHILENNNLADALSAILQQLSDGTGVQTAIRVTGSPRRLAPVVENNLLRVGQEAIANATRHAHARHILLALEFTDRQLCLEVTDDGDGFDSIHPPPGEGGFGLVGMRERARQLKGALTICSASGKGTEVRLIVQLTE